MYPDSPFAHEIGSFQTPVLAPEGWYDTPPLVTVCFSESWLPYVIGCLKQLLLQSTWDYGDLNQLAVLQQNAFSLIGLFQGGVAGCPAAPLLAWRVLVSGAFEFPDFQNFVTITGDTAVYLAFGETVGDVFTGHEVVFPYNECGGLWDRFDFYSNSSGSLISVTAVDCLDTPITWNGVGEFHLNYIGTDIALKSLSLATTTPGRYIYQCSGPILCGVS